MPSRIIVAKELADIFKVMGHPDRIRLIEEMRPGEEKDVKALAESLGLAGPRVSQHLSLLRAYRIVEERRDGRHHYYSLIQPQIADWIIEGIDFLEVRSGNLKKSQLTEAKKLWS
jgi:DNA-binding transcriptional ArsR family regulator